MKQVIRDEIPPKVQEVVHDVSLLVRQEVSGGGVHLSLGIRVPWMDCHDQAEAHHGGKQRSEDEEENRPECNHAIHLNHSSQQIIRNVEWRDSQFCQVSAAWKITGSYLSVQRCRASDEAGDDQREDHQLEEPHEQLSRVGHQSDGLRGQLELSQSQAKDESRDNRCRIIKICNRYKQSDATAKSLILKP